jgi:hypothetical protein
MKAPGTGRGIRISGPHLIGPGWGKHFFLWTARP